MSLKTLHLDIVEDTEQNIANFVLETQEDIDRFITESCDCSEVTFKPARATEFLKAHNAPRLSNSGDCFRAYALLERLVRQELKYSLV